VLLGVLNDKFVAGITGLVPLSHFLQFLHDKFSISMLRSAQFLKINISQGSGKVWWELQLQFCSETFLKVLKINISQRSVLTWELQQ